MGALLRQYYANKQREWTCFFFLLSSLVEQDGMKKKKALVKRRSYSMKNERLLSLAAAPHR